MNKVYLVGLLTLLLAVPVFGLTVPKSGDRLYFRDTTLTVQSDGVDCEIKALKPFTFQARGGRYYFSLALTDLYPARTAQ